MMTDKNTINAEAISDDELDMVTGGLKLADSSNANKVERMCPTCNENKLFRLASGGRAYCQDCGTQIII